MSIKSQIDRINGEVGKQTDLLAQISKVLDGKAAGIVPTGTVQITENGTHDVAEYASAEITVPVGVFPEGTLEITENGEHDVSGYASVDVNVPEAGNTVETCTVTLKSTFAGVNTLIQGYAEAYTLEADYSTAEENGTAIQLVGEFVEKSIAVSVPKGSVIYAWVCFDFEEPHSGGLLGESSMNVYTPDSISLTGQVLMLARSEWANGDVVWAGDYFWQFAVYGDCTITFAPINEVKIDEVTS